jgi:hypothetical protein
VRIWLAAEYPRRIPGWGQQAVPVDSFAEQLDFMLSWENEKLAPGLLNRCSRRVWIQWHFFRANFRLHRRRGKGDHVRGGSSPRPGLMRPRNQGFNTPHAGGKIEMENRDIRAALDRHWAASDANDFEAEHQIYQQDAVLEYPQSGERIRGRHNIQASRFAQPNKKRFTVRRILGAGDLWLTELVLTYDGQPSYTVSIMEFKDGKVVRETQYFGDPFEPGPSRVQWVERML